MVFPITLNLIDRGGGLFEVSDRKQAATAREVRTETSLLHNHRPATRQIYSSPITEGSAVGGDEVIFADAEFASRRLDVLSPIIERQSGILSIYDFPAGFA